MHDARAKCRGNLVCKRQTQSVVQKKANNELKIKTEEKKSMLKVSSIYETHKHASLNDFVSFPSKGWVNVAFVHIENSRICKEEKKGLQLKRNGYLAIREWVLI